ncbi:hypothetical protein EMIT0111MI5_30191 [Burkholderia sp. IT-111MI5]
MQPPLVFRNPSARRSAPARSGRIPRSRRQEMPSNLMPRPPPVRPDSLETVQHLAPPQPPRHYLVYRTFRRHTS